MCWHLGKTTIILAEETTEIGDYVYCSQPIGQGAFGAVHKGCHKEVPLKTSVYAHWLRLEFADPPGGSGKGDQL